MSLLILALAAKSRKGGAFWSKVKGATRVVAYGTVLAVGVSAVLVRNAKANVDEGSMRFGRELAGVADLLGDTKEVQLNGEKMYISQSSTPDDVRTVLNRFEGHCNEDPAMKGVDWQDVADSKLTATSGKGGGLDVMRREEGDEGVVMCFRRTNQTKTFVDAIKDFTNTHDFGSIGSLRYVHVTRNPKQGKTAVQVVWTNGSFKVDNLMPPENGQDAPGSDPVVLARPQRSQRILTAVATGTNYSVRMYRSTDSVDAALASYDAQMNAANWAIVEAPKEVRGEQVGHWYERDGAQAMVSITSDSEGRSVLTLGDMGTAERAPTRQIHD